MRFGFARVVHKSNSFAQTPTSLADFERLECLSGSEIVAKYTSTSTTSGGIIDAANDSETDMVPILSAIAPSGGHIETEAIEQLAERIARGVQEQSEPLDGLIVELTGAMTTMSGSSGDEELINRLQQAVPGLPIGLLLSPQANVTSTLANSCVCVARASHTPDSDPRSTGRNAVDMLRRSIEMGSGVNVTASTLPLLVPVAAQRSLSQPLRDIEHRASEERANDKVLSIAIFPGYPYTDAPHAGSSVVVTGSGDCSDVVSNLRDELWHRRAEFFVQGSNVEEAVHYAMASKQGPVLIADLGDNPDDGAPGDGTTVLWALLDLGVRNATVAAIVDKEAVAACFNAGEGGKVEIPVGGRLDTRHGYPIDIRAKVTSLHEGQFTLNGPIGAGLTVDAGRIVVLDVEARHEGRVELILTEKPLQVTDTALFEHVGIDIRERAIVSIKSTNDYLPAFEPCAAEIFEVITPGITTPDPAFFAYQHVRRPIYPLDPVE